MHEHNPTTLQYALLKIETVHFAFFLTDFTLCTSLCSYHHRVGLESHGRGHCLHVSSFVLTQAVLRSISNTGMFLNLNSEPFVPPSSVSLLCFCNVCLFGCSLKAAFTGISSYISMSNVTVSLSPSSPHLCEYLELQLWEWLVPGQTMFNSSHSLPLQSCLPSVQHLPHVPNLC